MAASTLVPPGIHSGIESGWRHEKKTIILVKEEAPLAENKTRPNTATVSSFLRKINDPEVRKDCDTVIKLMESISKQKPVMWGSSIIGFGIRHYVYESGREGDTMVVGFSPRKQAIVLYLAGGPEPLRDELSKLGKHATGKGCLYIKSLREVDVNVLKTILTKSYKSLKQSPCA